MQPDDARDAALTASGGDYWLERIAASPDLRARAATYDEWSATYDADTLGIGYMNPAVAAALAGRHLPDRSVPLLDAGAGTGVLGAILQAVGYTDIVGLDISAGMLERARERGAYRELHERTLGEPLGFDDGRFGAVIAIGVFAFGHAPPAALDELVRVTRPGGHLIFNVNTAPWENGGFKDKVEALEAAGRWSLLEVTNLYAPMALSASRGHFTSRALVYRLAAG